MLQEQKRQAKDIAFSKLSQQLARLDFSGEQANDQTPPAIFICGAPRSGTTLLYQCLSFVWNVGYINNLIARFAAHPPTGIFLAKALGMEPEFSGKSVYGATEGLSEPHEFGKFWLDSFALKSLDQPLQSSAEEITAGIRKIIQVLHSFEQPVVFKSFAYIWYIEQIAKTLPNSIWIEVERPLDDNARSLEAFYRTRTLENGTAPIWTSANLAMTRELYSQKPLAERCRAQISDLSAYIALQLAKLPNERTAKVSLPDLVVNSAETLTALSNKFRMSIRPLAIEEVTRKLNL